jgi:hypothetical protein
VRTAFQPFEGSVPSRQRPLAINIVQHGTGEWFDIQLLPDVQLRVMDTQPRLCHLLLSATNWLGEERFLCGHDERHWFVAALPSEPRAGTVEEAKEALKPDLIRTVERRKRQGKQPPRSDVFIRQGEWFFIPWPHASIDWNRILRNAPLTRGTGSKPHFCELMYQDGEREYECDRYPRLAFFESEYKEMLRTRRKAKRWNWRPRPFQPDIYVQGWVTHPDHSPFCLDVWHRVELSKEATELSMSSMIFRD